MNASTAGRVSQRPSSMSFPLKSSPPLGQPGACLPQPSPPSTKASQTAPGQFLTGTVSHRYPRRRRRVTYKTSRYWSALRLGSQKRPWCGWCLRTGKHRVAWTGWDAPLDPQLSEPRDGNFQPYNSFLYCKREVPLGQQLDYDLQSGTDKDVLSSGRLRAETGGNRYGR